MLSPLGLRILACWNLVLALAFRVRIFLIVAIPLAFIEFAHGIQQQIGRRTKHCALRGGGAINKLINAFVGGVATPDDLSNSFVAEECAALSVDNLTAAKKNDAIGFACVDVQRARLAGLSEHLNHAREIEM